MMRVPENLLNIWWYLSFTALVPPCLRFAQMSFQGVTVCQFLGGGVFDHYSLRQLGLLQWNVSRCCGGGLVWLCSTSSLSLNCYIYKAWIPYQVKSGVKVAGDKPVGVRCPALATCYALPS